MPKLSGGARERDSFLDLLRGLAALNIILIHTAFWSGEAYVPTAIRSATLAVDVPFFFFLSGWSMSYVRSLKKSLLSLLNTYLKYLVFLAAYWALLLGLQAAFGRGGGLTLENLLANLRFQSAGNTALPVVMGSIWFMQVYCLVIPAGALVCWLALWLSGGERRLLNLLLGVALAADLFGLVFTWRGGTVPWLPLDVRFYFYLAFVLLGLLCREASIPRLSWALGLIGAEAALMLLAARRLGLNWTNMQDMKFPPNVVYFFFSLISVTAALWLRGRRLSPSPGNPLCRIGRAALLFYFCQGIGASVLMMLIHRVELVWYLKLPLAYCINLAVTLVCVVLLAGLYRLVFRPLPSKGGSRERIRL